MGEYKITAGQNIYDVAMHLYGSIDGIADLFINNPELSFNDDLRSGDTLQFTDGFTVDEGTVAYNRMRGIVPANGQRHVYPKHPAGQPCMEIRLDNTKTAISFLAAGTGEMEADWGDNTEIETLVLSGDKREYLHYFDDRTPWGRRVRLYGDALFRELDLTASGASEIYTFRPVIIEKFTFENAVLELPFLSLSQDTFDLDLKGLSASSLLPLLPLGKLMKIDLRGKGIRPPALDEYLTALVREYGGRRSCTVCLSVAPTGNYGEPRKDENGNYLLVNGMEAAWVLTHEAAWNEGGCWKFIINEKTYTYEPDNPGNL